MLSCHPMWSLSAQTETASPTSTPTPTRDRLAQPPLVENPTQADDGEQVYWLYCSPCHGDMGQGLTDEWREVYPPDHQDCWSSGCHGARPYENGFQIPQYIPAIIGTDVLTKFATTHALYQYLSVAMPFNAPNSLEKEEYLSLSSFLLRENGQWDGIALTEAQLISDLDTLPIDVDNPVRNDAFFRLIGVVGIAAGLLTLIALSAWFAKRRKP